MFWFVGIFALGGAVFHFVSFSPSVEAAKSHAAAKQSLDEARKARDEYGVQRRLTVKKWAEEQRAQQVANQGESPIDEDEYGSDALSIITAGEDRPLRKTKVLRRSTSS
ncbi:hypothetical protein FRC02_012215 [Tulasnella sp. 418]|nr:hypothetical protein FRC02_012215 [Tulasnella sp. 418]